MAVFLSLLCQKRALVFCSLSVTGIILCAFADDLAVPEPTQLQQTRTASPSGDGTRSDQLPPTDIGPLTAGPTYHVSSAIRLPNWFKNKRLFVLQAQDHQRTLLRRLTTALETADVICRLSTAQRRRYLNATTREWLLNSVVLDEIENDLQLVVNCSRPGDVLLLNTSKTIQPPSRTVIPWPLTINGYVHGEEHDDVDISPPKRTTLTCPQKNEGLFTLRAIDVTLTDLSIEGCLFDVSGTSESIVDVEECTSSRARGTIRLHRVGFRDSRLNGAVALEADTTSCSVVEIQDLDFRGNFCNGVCGILLARENRLLNITIEQNQPILSSNSGSVIVRMPPQSAATVDQIRAFANNCPIFEIEGGSFNLSNGNFTKNSETDVNDRSSSVCTTAVEEHFVGACIRFKDAFASIRDCCFEKNQADSGSAISARGSNIVLKDCAFRENTAHKKGTVLLRNRSSLTVFSSLFFSNTAGISGGAIDAQKTELTLTHLTCVQNEAGLKGACLHVVESSSLKLSHSVSKNNSIRANSGEGGAVWTNGSVLSITDSTFLKNSAVRGGAMWIQHSVFSIAECRFENNSATNGSALVVRDCPSLQDRQQNEKCTVPIRGNAEEAIGCGWVNAAGSFTHVTFVNNTAVFYGGSVYVSGSAVSFTACIFKNGEAFEGGFVNSVDNSSVSIHNSTFDSGIARNYGGCLAFRNAYLILESTTLQYCSSRESGAADLVLVSAKIINSSILSNHANAIAGGIYFARSNVTAIGLIVEENEAGEGGGGILVDWESHFTVQDSVFRNNNALFGGAVEMAFSAVGSFTRVIFKDNFARQTGGSLSIHNATLRIQESHFSDGSAVRYGGFIVVNYNGSLDMENVSMTNGSAINGGAIALNDTTFNARRLDVFRCEAKMGGAIKAKRSTVSCIDCSFRENVAETEGGGIAFRSNGKQKRALQLEGSVMAKNTARKGGGLHWRSGFNGDDCPSGRGGRCSFAMIVDTRFEENFAESAGGAIFVDRLEAIRVSCTSVQENDYFTFLPEKDWGQSHSLTSERDFCPTWKGNRAELYGPTVASFAAQARMTIDYGNKREEIASGEVHVFDDYLGGSLLPTLSVLLVDHFQQTPAIGYHVVVAKLSTPDTFGVSNISVRMPQGNITFPLMVGFGPPDAYNMTVAFSDRAIGELTMTVVVRNCKIGEMAVGEIKLCTPCSSSTYNFDREVDKCHPCPENGNCETSVIIPEDGYWLPSPCSVHIERCLTSHACNFKGRLEILKNVTDNLENCSMSHGSIKEYQGMQCTQGHCGPLCGSCVSSYSSSLSSRCRKCPSVFGDVAVICVSVLILAVLSGITIRGTLTVAKEEQTTSCGQDSISHCIQMSPVASSNGKSTRQETRSAVGLQDDSAKDEHPEGLPATEQTLAQWKAVEMFKITLNFLNLTVLLGSLDVGWDIPVLIMAESAEFFGGLAIDSIQHSAICLGSEDTRLHPTVWASIMSVCIVPAFVFLLLALFWIAAVIRYGVDKPFRYLAKRSLLSLMALWYISSVPVIKTTLSTLLCVNAYNTPDATQEKDGKIIDATEDATISYWVVDTSLKCFEDDHLMLAILILSFVGLVYGGLLIAFIIILRTFKEQLNDTDSWIYQTMGFLYRGYRRGRRRYWEVAIVARKAGIAFLVFCSHRFDSSLPIVGAAVFLTLAMGGQMVAMPYRQSFDELNRVDILSLFVSLLTTLLATMLKSEGLTDDAGRLAISLLCVLLNITTLVLLAHFLFGYSVAYVKLSLGRSGTIVDSYTSMLHVLRIWLFSQIQNVALFMGSSESDDLSSICSGT